MDKSAFFFLLNCIVRKKMLYLFVSYSQMTVNDCKIIDLPKIPDKRGNLSFLQNFDNVPFEIRRSFWLYDVPGGESRGGHAYRQNEEFIIALSGSFDVIIDDGAEKRTFQLNRSYKGLYVPKGLWREINNFSTNSLALELASTHYDENDYIRGYDEYLNLKRNGQI